MLVSNQGGVPKLAGDRGRSMVTSNMGNGTKFKLSSVIPNVFSKIKGIRKSSSLQKLSISPSIISECPPIDIDQKDFSTMSRDSHGGSSPASPVRTFPQNRNGDVRYSSSPVQSQKAHDIRFPAESPIRSKGSNKSGPLSPPPRVKSAAEMVDPGCCSYDSTIALVPHDGRVRRVAPQAFGRCLLMTKCNSFNGSTHSDSEVSETDSSTAHGRIRHSRAMSVQLEGSSCEGYGRLTTAADERGSQRSGKVSIPHRSTERRDHNGNIVDRSHQLYGGSSPIQDVRSVYSNSNAIAKYRREDHSQGSSDCRGSAFLNSGMEETGELDHDQTHSRRHGRPSRKLSFTADDNTRPFDDTSFSSDDDFYKVVTSNANVTRGHYRSRSTSTNKNSQLQHIYGGNQDTDSGYTSSEVVYTEDDKNHAAAILRREALLAKTVLNASDGWAQVQLSRFSQDEKPTRGAASFDGAEQTCEGDSEAPVYSREARLVKTVLNAQGWARENLRALAKANELDRQNLARLKVESLDLLARREDEADKIEYETFGLPPHSRDFFSKSSRHLSTLGEEVEKYTEGRVDYRSFSPVSNLSKSDRNLGHEDFPQTVPEYARNLHKSGRTDKSEKEFGKPWETEFPSFRSDSILMGGGIASDRTSMHEERAALIDCTECEAPAALTPRYSERQRQNKIRVGQQQDFRNCGKVSSRSPSQREEMISGGTKNFKLSNQSSSPRPSHPKRSPSSIQEFSNGKKLPSSPTPSPVQEIKGRRNASRTPSPVQDFHKVKKSSSTPSPARNQPPQSAAKPLTAKAEAGMQRLDSVAVVKASYDPYHDFRESMVEMILENDIRTAEDLEDLLQCYLSLNSSEYHKIIVQVFSDVWGDIFEP